MITHTRCKLYLCSFTLFIVLNRGSHECHSDNKTGDRVDAADNDDDGDDVIDSQGEKEHRSAAKLDRWGLSFTLIQLFFSLNSVIRAICLS